MSDSLRDRIQRHEAKLAALQQQSHSLSERVENARHLLKSAQRGILPASYAEFRQEQLAALEGQLAQVQRDAAREELALTDARQAFARAQSDESHQQAIARAMLAIDDLRKLPEKIVVLFLAAQPGEEMHLRLDEEARAIHEMIRKARHRDAVRFETAWAVRPLDLLERINEHEPRVIHFSGHGTRGGDLVFQTNDGLAKTVSQAAFVQTIQSTTGNIQLVVLNACHSHSQAAELVRHVPAAVGMLTRIGDKAARVFASYFYSAIGYGKSVRQAFEQAKASLMLEGIPEHETPALFVADGQDASQLILVRPPE